MESHKLKLMHRTHHQPDSIKNLAKDTHRKISTVTRDIDELEKVSIVQIHSVINPGHGRHKIVELTAKKLKLEVSINICGNQLIIEPLFH